MKMLKGLQVLPFYIKRLPFKEAVGKKIIPNCRCLYLASILQKSKKKSMLRSVDDELRRLKKENPHIKEPPIIYQPILVEKVDLEDDISHLGHNTRSAVKKEKVYVIQPYFKSGKEKTKLVDHRLAEAESLINSVQMWEVHEGCIENIREVNHNFYFGSGKVKQLSGMIRNAINYDGVTMVFINTERLTSRQTAELESNLGCKVFDRFRVVLELLKKRANTKGAKLQVLLAEIQFLRSYRAAEPANYDQQKGGGQSMSGRGETEKEISRRILDKKERKLKEALLKMKDQKVLIRSERAKNRVPEVAMVGYTNAGKTALAKALSRSNSLEPEDMLFATLDSTAHNGRLPCGLNLVYIDTVGFVSELPPELVEVFTTTLEDVRTADLLIHVTDCSHPEFELQKQTVENILEKLNLPEGLMRNKITVLNKSDLRSQSTSDGDANTIAISATEGDGIEELRIAIEEKIMQSTGREKFNVNLDLNHHGDELSWLRSNGTILDTIYTDNGLFDVVVILDDVGKNTFEGQFNLKLVKLSEVSTEE